jgi:hypothetical protein
MRVGLGFYGTATLCDGGTDVRSYEHHTLEEPAVDCWNITDGIIDLGIAQLILREGYWSDYFEANGTYLLGIGLQTLHMDCEYIFNALQNTLPEFRIERNRRRQSLDLLLHLRPSALVLTLHCLNLVQLHFPTLLQSDFTPDLRLSWLRRLLGFGFSCWGRWSHLQRRHEVGNLVIELQSREGGIPSFPPDPIDDLCWHGKICVPPRPSGEVVIVFVE